jgi:hypothetical protein
MKTQEKIKDSINEIKILNIFRNNDSTLIKQTLSLQSGNSTNRNSDVNPAIFFGGKLMQSITCVPISNTN